jgi:8-oxo-dGTP diphosphatase
MVKLVTAAIMMKGDRVLIAKRKAGVTSMGGWEFPGGKIEEGESPEACLAREMQEELGILVEVGSFFGESVYDYNDGTIELRAYWTRWISGDMRLNVHDEVRWVKLDMLQGFDFLPADVPLAEKLAAVGLSEY